MVVFWNVASCTSYWPTFRRSSLPPTWERSASAAPQKAASRLHAHRPDNSQLTELVSVSLTESSRHASSATELVRVGTEQVSVTSYRSSWKSRDGKRGLLRKWTLLIREHAPPRPTPGSSSPQSLLHLHPRVQLIWKIALGLLRTLLRFMITMRLGLCSNYKRPSYVINSTKSSYSGRGNKQRNLRGNAMEHVHKHFYYSLLIFI
jgi:hypothetical protein